MAKYWAKIDGAVEGPYEAGLLPFLQSFDGNLLVSEDAVAEEIWTRAADAPGLKSLFRPRGLEGVPKEDAMVPGIISPPDARNAVEIRFQEVAAPETALHDLELAIQKASKPSVFGAESDVMEVMDKISVEAAQVPAPVPGISLEPRPAADKTRPWTGLLVGLACLAAAAAGLWFFKDQLRGRFLDRQAKATAAAPQAVAAPKAALPAPAVQTAPADPKPKAKPAVTVQASAPVKRETSEEIKFKSQKFILPGVPSPNVVKSVRVEKREEPPASAGEDAAKIDGTQPAVTEEGLEKEKPASEPEAPKERDGKERWSDLNQWGN